MISLDKIPATIGLVLSAIMVIAGIFLGIRMLPWVFGDTSSASVATNSLLGSTELLADQVDSDSAGLFSAPLQSTENQTTTDQSTLQISTTQSSGVTSAGGTSAGGTSAGGTSAGGTNAGVTSAGGTSAGAEQGEEAESSQGSTDGQSSPEQSAAPTPSDTAADAGQSADRVEKPVQITYSITPPRAIQSWVNSQPNLSFVSAADVDADLPSVHVGVERQNGIPAFKQTYAAATRFNTLESNIDFSQIKAIWRGTLETLPADQQPVFTNISILQEDAKPLTALLGTPSSAVEFVTSTQGLREATKRSSPTLLLLSFEQLIPSFAVLAVNNQNPIENANNYNDDRYPLKATYYLRWQGFTSDDQPTLNALLDGVPESNRDPSKLTVVAMTGVTAMVRGTAAQMDRFGSAWPAEIVGPELASADITHISNEVPFVADCETNTSPRNLIFCSKLSYLDTLTASGVDIIGLTGNHQNDYGREDALASLAFYAENNLPVYGGGVNSDAAHAPLYLEHNGNRLAFMGANSYGPNFAWATEERPGSARFDLAVMSANIRAAKESGQADVLFAEVQYQETYEVMPLIQQRIDFNALLAAGADVVTGVQSHVPQAIEFTEGKLVLYGLGNLFFDQMGSQPVREGFIVKHTIYDGRHISTRLLPTMLHDYGQPHWTTPTEREYLLRRVFQASYWE